MKQQAPNYCAHRSLFTGLLVFFLLTTFSSAVLSAPKAKLWVRWAKHDINSVATIDHSRWQALLDTHLTDHTDGITRFAYADVSAQERAQLTEYIDDLASIAISEFSRDEQYAYWVNLYNAVTVNVVLEKFPIDSIRDISTNFFSRGPWNMDLVTVEGHRVTLNDIEHRILRPIWQEARTHYALNCASLGCPNLQAQAFTAANTDALLTEAARAYINHPRGVTVTKKGLVLSSLYKWFSVDFGDDIFKHLTTYADAELRAVLAARPKIRDYEYDWSLNRSL